MVINTHNLFSEMNSKIYPVMTFIRRRMETVIFILYNFRVSRRFITARCSVIPLRAYAFRVDFRSANFAKFSVNLD